MQYKNIRMTVDSGHSFLLLDIDGMEAEIPSEQKPLLWINGFIYIQPDKVWSCILPPIDISIEGHYHSTLRGFIRSKTLVSLIIEMSNTLDVEVFNRKWSKKILTEKTNQVTKFNLIDQLDHFTI